MMEKRLPIYDYFLESGIHNFMLITVQGSTFTVHEEE